MAQLWFGAYRSELRYTHFLFRFPAKFHAPALRCLIERYSKKGDFILDPFCGSGTLLVEAMASGRNAAGLDIDPLATFIARVKAKPINPEVLESEFQNLKTKLAKIRRPPAQYDRFMHEDLSPKTLVRWKNVLQIPPIPNIEHWFRTYVVLDLARLRATILESPIAPRVRDFFLGCFASIIRNASNADPVPVSGLEVTSHMRQLDEAGRRIDPFDLFEKRVRREIGGMRELWIKKTKSTIWLVRGDVAALAKLFPSRKFDLVITSPPYNTAVDYYRRHMLEMYWLGLVGSPEERIALSRHYIGRASIRKDNRRLRSTFESPYVKRLIAHARDVGSKSERAVTHYCASMHRALEQINEVLDPEGLAVFVVGNSKWNGRRVRATKLLIELAKEHFKVKECLSYAARNRYMSYERRNGANVNREYVVVLQRRT